MSLNKSRVDIPVSCLRFTSIAHSNTAVTGVVVNVFLMLFTVHIQVLCYFGLTELCHYSHLSQSTPPLQSVVRMVRENAVTLRQTLGHFSWRTERNPIRASAVAF